MNFRQSDINIILIYKAESVYVFVCHQKTSQR